MCCGMQAFRALLILLFGVIVLVGMGIYDRYPYPSCDLEESKIFVPNNQRSSDFAYLFMLSSNSYFPCLAVALHSLKQTGTKHDVVVLVTDNIWEELDDALRSLHTIPIRVPGVRNPSAKATRRHLRDNFTKLRAWQLVEYSKIIYSDSDFIFTKNCDDLFELPDIVYAGRNFITTQGKWPDPKTFNAGFMVLEPSAETFCDMQFASVGFTSRTGGDQPFQNMYWNNTWKEFNYKIDAANANVYFTRRKDWNATAIRSIHYTKATNPCNTKFQDDIRQAWEEFDENGFPAENPLVMWIQARDNLLAAHPEFNGIFDTCGFMQGWNDGGQAAQPLLLSRSLGFL